MKTKESFTASYDGPAFQKHSMDVRDLGPALLSLGQLFDEANRVLNGDKVVVNLQVKAHVSGSFNIHLELIQSLSSQVTTFLTSDYVESAANLFALIAGGTGTCKGVCWLIKKLRGRKPDKIIDLKDGFVKIEFNGEEFQVSLKTLRLYQDLGVWDAINKVIKPLEREDVESFSFQKDEEILETINKSNYLYFTAPKISDELISEVEHKAAYSIISLAFKEDNKWRLHDGNSIISAIIKDEEFIKKVDKNEISFAKGDILMCRVKVFQWKTDSGLKTEYEVLKVEEHRAAARQLTLFVE